MTDPHLPYLRTAEPRPSVDDSVDIEPADHAREPRESHPTLGPGRLRPTPRRPARRLAGDRPD